MRVACAVMQRDEDLVLDGWCRYHGSLFGYENLYIFDNGSTNSVVLDALTKYHRLGCSVVTEHVGPRGFEDKGEIIGRLFHQLRSEGSYDFFLPLDCDEFISVLQGPAVSFQKKDIEAQLSRFIGCPDTIKIIDEFANSPQYPGYFLRKPANKTAYAAQSFQKLDHGYHHPGTATGEMVPSSLVHIHFHNKPFERTLADARRKLIGHGVDVNDIAVIENLKHSTHLISYFKMTEVDFYKSFLDRLHFPATGFPQRMIDLGVSSPLLTEMPRDDEPPHILPLDFDSAEYLTKYPDVAAAGFEAARHYMLFGFAEGREVPIRHR